MDSVQLDTKPPLQERQESNSAAVQTLAVQRFTSVLNPPTMKGSMLGVNTATLMTCTASSNGVVRKGVRSVAYIMLAGPHERSMDEALKNLDEMLKLDAEFAVFAVLHTRELEKFRKVLSLFPADCWDRLMKEPLCGVEVPVCWTEHLTQVKSSIC